MYMEWVLKNWCKTRAWGETSIILKQDVTQFPHPDGGVKQNP